MTYVSKNDLDFRPHASWMCPGEGCCAVCGYPVVVTQGQDTHSDYAWYCSNPACARHAPVENTGDMECPDWVAVPEPTPSCGKCPHGLVRHCSDGSCIPCCEMGIDQGVCADPEEVRRLNRESAALRSGVNP